MLRGAHVNAQWIAPPTIDEIRARDQARLLESVLTPEDAADDDLTIARQLLEQRSAGDIAAALVRMHRMRLPEPKGLLDRDPNPRGPAHQRRPDARGPGRGERTRPAFQTPLW